MKIIKTYALSEKTLEKDIDKFIIAAKRGGYQYDYKYGMEGLKIIKTYFRMIQEEFDKQNYAVCRVCYKKLLFMLIQRNYNYFDYEDIIGRSKLDFEKIVTNYFACIIKLGSVEEVFNEYVEYLKVKGEPDYDYADQAIIKLLSDSDLAEFAGMVEKGAVGVKEKDYAFHDFIYFLLALAKHKKDKNAYYRLCERFGKIVGEEQKKGF